MVIKGLEKWGDSIVEEKLNNGNTLYYVESEGTFFPVGIYLKEENRLEVYSQVNKALMDILNNSRKYGFRVRIWYGDRKTRKAWNEEYDVTGRVGRSQGDIKIPLLIYSKRSYGGGALLVGSILRVDDIEDKRTLWKAEGFNIPKMTLSYKDTGSLYVWHVYQEGKEIAGFKTEEKARKWIDFTNGRRYSK